MAINYLNRFLATAWPFAADLLKNEIIQNAKQKADDRGLNLYVSDTSMNMSVAPAFSLSGTDLHLRFPGHGTYTLSTTVEKRPTFWYPEIDLSVSIWAEMVFTTGLPKIDIHVDVSSDTGGEIADWITGWKGDLESQVRQGFKEHLGFFNSARYAPANIAAVQQPELIYGFAELEKDKAVDIVLVSDGFTASNMADFSFIADQFKTKFTTETSSRVNEPFLSFSSVMRIWKMQVPETDVTNIAHRYMAKYFDDPTQTDKTALANLAKLAATGPLAEAVGMDVLVLMADRNAIGGNARAMTMGGLIMLPVSKNSAAADASILIHELGHSVLGGLADEYVKNDKTYRSKEPAAPNVTVDRPTANKTHPVKWTNWLLHPEALPVWDHNKIKSVEGAYEYKLGIWRPADTCKMNDSNADIAFCAVCREAITRRVRKLLGQGSFLVEIEDLGTHEVNRVNIIKENDLVYRVRIPESGQKKFRITLLASSFPKPWRMAFQTTSASTPVIHDNTCTVDIKFGNAVSIVMNSYCPFTPWDSVTPLVAQIHFDLPLRDIPEAPPTTPINLGASGSPDRIGHPVLKTLSASSSDPNADDVRFEFEIVEAPGSNFTGTNTLFSDYVSWTIANPEVRGKISKIFGPGGYRFRVRAEDRLGQHSAWSEPKTFIVPAPIPA